MSADNVHQLAEARAAREEDPDAVEFEAVSATEFDDDATEPTPEALAEIEAAPVSVDDIDGEALEQAVAADEPNTPTVSADELEPNEAAGEVADFAESDEPADAPDDQATAAEPAPADLLFDADQYSASRPGGRRATTGAVTITGGKVDDLVLDSANVIPKGASVKLEVVGKLKGVHYDDTEKDGYVSGTVRDHKVKASFVRVLSWQHDDHAVRWAKDTGLERRVKGKWVSAKELDEPVVFDETEPEAAAEVPGPGYADGSPEGVPDAPADGEQLPLEVPGTEPDGAPEVDPSFDDGDPTFPAEAPASAYVPIDGEVAEAIDEAVGPQPEGDVVPFAPGVVLGRPETYTPDNLAKLGGDDLREVLASLGVSDLPAKIDDATLLAMATTASASANE